MDVRPQDGIDMALALGRKALTDNPKADALLLAGGAWLSLAAIPVLWVIFPVMHGAHGLGMWAGLLRGRRS